MPKTRLFKVEDTFLIRGQGLIVEPSPLLSEYSGSRELNVTLIKPDSSSLKTCLHFYVVLQNPSPPTGQSRWGCMFHQLSKEDVPIGTEIWYDEPA